MTRLNIASLVFGLLLTFGVVAQAQETAEKGSMKKEGAASQDAMTLMIPKATAKHKVVFSDLGKWDCDIKVFMGPEPTIAKGVEENRALGAFWMTSNFDYELNGVQMHGHGQFGYNAATKKYQGTWIDSASDSLTLMDGSYDEASKTMTWSMNSKDPAGNDVKMRIIDQRTSETTRDFKMQMQSPNAANPGDFISIMEMKLTKQKEMSKAGSGNKDGSMKKK